MNVKRAPQSPVSRKLTSLWIALMLVFFSQMLIYTWSRVQTIQRGYDIISAQGERQRLMAEQEKLKIELARLKSPERVARIAKDDLGLVSPTQLQTMEME